VPVMAFISAAGAMRDEMKSGTVDYVLTRPLPKPALVVFKYLAHLACAQVDFLCAFAVVVAIGMYRHAPGLTAILPNAVMADWPERTVKIIVTFPPGSANDAAARALRSRFQVNCSRNSASMSAPAQPRSTLRFGQMSSNISRA